MVFSANFVTVLGFLVEPELKLRVEGGGGRSIASGSEKISVFYDPEIRADRLTMPFPDDMKTFWKKYNKTPPPEECVFESNKSQEITSFIVNIIEEADRIKLRMANNGSGFLYDRSLIDKSGVPGVQGHACELITAILKSLVNLASWDERAASFYGPVKRQIALYLERSLAEELAAASDFSFDRNVSGDVFVAERQVQA